MGSGSQFHRGPLDVTTTLRLGVVFLFLIVLFFAFTVYCFFDCFYFGLIVAGFIDLVWQRYTGTVLLFYSVCIGLHTMGTFNYILTALVYECN